GAAGFLASTAVAGLASTGAILAVGPCASTLASAGLAADFAASAGLAASPFGGITAAEPVWAFTPVAGVGAPLIALASPVPLLPSGTLTTGIGGGVLRAFGISFLGSSSAAASSGGT